MRVIEITSFPVILTIIHGRMMINAGGTIHTSAASIRFFSRSNKMHQRCGVEIALTLVLVHVAWKICLV